MISQVIYMYIYIKYVYIINIIYVIYNIYINIIYITVSQTKEAMWIFSQMTLCILLIAQCTTLIVNFYKRDSPTALIVKKHLWL